MIGDRAYDSDPLDQRLRKQHRIRLIAPHKFNRRRKNTQDGRELRRYCRRWKIERLFAWLHNFRRLVSRWEYCIGPDCLDSELSVFMPQLRAQGVAGEPGRA